MCASGSALVETERLRSQVATPAPATAANRTVWIMEMRRPPSAETRKKQPRPHRSQRFAPRYGAISNGEHTVAAGGRKRCVDHDLIRAVGFQPGQLMHEVWRLDARGPCHEIRLCQPVEDRCLATL